MTQPPPGPDPRWSGDGSPNGFGPPGYQGNQQPGFAQPGYPQSGYPEPGYPQPGSPQPGTQPGYPPQQPGGGPVFGSSSVCTWHPNRPTALFCTRCGKPACPDCLRDAAVGKQCRDCVRQGNFQHTRTVAGARMGVPPLVASILIVVNLAVFVLVSIQAKSVENPDVSRVFADGGLMPVQVGHGEYWRLLTNGFLHLGLIHIAANMVSLYFLGPPLERILGRARFLVVYLISLLGGSTAVMLFSDPMTITVGASGAIFGLMGALIVTFKRLKYDLRQLGAVLAINIFVTFQMSGISWQGHMGGLVVGALIGAAMVLPAAPLRGRVQIGASVGLVAVLAALCVWRAGQVPDRTCEYFEGGVQGPGIYCTMEPPV